MPNPQPAADINARHRVTKASAVTALIFANNLEGELSRRPLDLDDRIQRRHSTRSESWRIEASARSGDGLRVAAGRRSESIASNQQTMV
jgi:hypothetical protein